MPKRSNIFQRLVHEIHRDLPGWKVIESRELIDTITGEPREVDIVAETTLPGYDEPVLIKIEVQDRSRRADVTWVELMAKKHEHLPSGTLILWSGSGFAKAALKKAAALGIKTVATGRALDAPWASAARELLGGTVQLVNPTFEAVVDVTLEDGTKVRWTVAPGMVLELSPEVPLEAVVTGIMNDPRTRAVVLDHAPGKGEGDFFSVLTLPAFCTVRRSDGLRAVYDRLIVGIHTRSDVVLSDVRTAQHGGAVITLAEGEFESGTLQFVMKESSEGITQVSRFKPRI
jgi:hypothetical protein